MGREVISKSVSENQRCVPLSLSACEELCEGRNALCHCFEPSALILLMSLCLDSLSLGIIHKLASETEESDLRRLGLQMLCCPFSVTLLPILVAVVPLALTSFFFPPPLILFLLK